MFLRIFKLWLPFAFIATVLAGTIYVTVHQNYRQSANDPQIRVAEDMANMINNGSDPHGFDLNDFGLPKTPPEVDVPQSLNTFLIIFNSEGNIITSNLDVTQMGSLQGIKLFDNGMFKYSKIHGENRITWEPTKGLRLATVIVPYKFPDTKDYPEFSGSGYVLVARNLREVEKRIEMLTWTVGFGWGVATFGSLILIFILEVLTPRQKAGR